MPAAPPLALCADACRRMADDGVAFVCWQAPCRLPASPLALFAGLPAGSRFLLAERRDWVLAAGVASEAPDSIHTSASRRLDWEQALLGRRAPRAWWTLQRTADGRLAVDGAWGRLPGLRLVLPRLLYRREGRTCIRQIIAPVRARETAEGLRRRLAAEAAHPGHLLPAPSGRTDDGLPWPAAPSQAYTAVVTSILRAIANGALNKAVPARPCDLHLPRRPDPLAILADLRRRAGPAATLYACDLPAGRLLLGATPELLLQRRGRRLESLALAGTGQTARLRASDKDGREHEPVVCHLASALSAWCRDLRLDRQPRLLRTGGLVHLATRLTGTVRNADTLDLLCALHPNPALVGCPLPAAQRLLRRHEGFVRGLYTGVLGLLHGDDAWLVVPLRGAVLRGRRARLYAGAGIVAGSQSEHEEREVAAKMALMRSALEASCATRP